MLNEKRRAERTSELLDGPEAAEGDKLSQETLQALGEFHNRVCIPPYNTVNWIHT